MSDIERPRFFPFGNGPLNEQGVAHYDDLIRSMVAVGIKPVITLFHWGEIFFLLLPNEIECNIFRHSPRTFQLVWRLDR
jgi:hypothetical protein